MLELWRNYVDVFRKLIVAGFIVVKRNGSSLYKWVYPHTSLPFKLSIREAHEILVYADKSMSVFGSTTRHAYPFRVTREPIREA